MGDNLLVIFQVSRTPRLILNSSKVFIVTWNIFTSINFDPTLGIPIWDFLFNSLAFSEAPVKLNLIFYLEIRNLRIIYFIKIHLIKILWHFGGHP